MIRPLRQRHRWMIPLLALAGAGVFVLALLARGPMPVMDMLPTALQATPDPAAPTWETADRWGDLGLTMQRRAHSLTLIPATALKQPDLLLYWVDTEPATATDVPSGALLLGAFGGAQAQTFDLPPHQDLPGHLLLYSLPQKRVLGTASLAAP